MTNKTKILGLSKVGDFLRNFLKSTPEQYNEKEAHFFSLLRKSENENPWFDNVNVNHALESWAELLNVSSLEQWLTHYTTVASPKKIGLILAGNIPMVGWHDVISVVLSGHIPIIKLSSKDRWMIPFLLEIWNENSENSLQYELVEKLENFDAVIATGSNNTARYLEFYFKDYKSIIRKNRTSVAVIKGDETEAELQLLADDIFTYYGLGCRNVTRLLIPQDYKLDHLFENFFNYKDIINHNKYANNYEYNRAIYLLNLDQFWDNNFVMLKEDEKLFSPLSVINFTRYQDLDEVKSFITNHEVDIQAVVAKPELGLETINFGEAQKPALDTYADNVDTMAFLTSL